MAIWQTILQPFSTWVDWINNVVDSSINFAKRVKDNSVRFSKNLINALTLQFGKIETPYLKWHIAETKKALWETFSMNSNVPFYMKPLNLIKWITVDLPMILGQFAYRPFIPESLIWWWYNSISNIWKSVKNMFSWTTWWYKPLISWESKAEIYRFADIWSKKIESKPATAKK